MVHEAKSSADEKMLAMNEALLLGSLRQHELAEASETLSKQLYSLNIQLHTEIDERKSIEAALRNSEAYSLSVFEANPDCVKVIDLGGHIERMNANGQCLMEIDDFGAIAGAHWPSLWPLESRIQIEAAIAEAKAGRSGRFSGLCLTAKGTPKWWDVIVTAVPGEFLSPIRLIAASRDITDRKQAESTLRESEDRFRTLFELGPIGVYSCDASGMIQDFNRRAVEMWGREPTLGDPGQRFCGSFKLFRPDGSFIPHERCPMADVATGKISEVLDGEVVVERPDGSRINVIVNIRPLKNERGEITGAINCFYDVTERKRSEAAISASEAQYRTLFNSIDEGFCIIEKIEVAPGKPTDFRYLEANPAFERHTGVSGVVGKTIREAFPGEPEEWFNTYDDILKDGESMSFERDLVSKGRVLQLYAFRLEDADRRRLAIVFQDITERKNAEKISQQLSAIVKSSEDAIISTDVNGIITSWNGGAESLLGYTPEEVIGEPLTILIPLDQQGEETGILRRIRSGQHIDHTETVRLHKDGSQVWVSLSVSPLRDAGGEVIGASKIIRDMTERRRADEHRNILVGELNHRAKNSLAMVRAIASQTLSKASSLADAQLAFDSRLGALARGHDLLTHGNWVGTDLASVVEAAVEPHGGGKTCFYCEGPFVQLTPATALTFTMAIHELCTNAAKYGALLKPEGTVSIVWQVTGNGVEKRLQLVWTESGGPSVTLPTRKGFGSRLIERALAMELNGEVRIDYRPSGVVCTIDAPLPQVELKVI